MSKGLEQKIRERAHAMWEQEGRVHGRADDHWREAERELAGPEEQPSAGADAAPKGTRKRRASAANGDAGSPEPSKAATRRKKLPPTS